MNTLLLVLTVLSIGCRAEAESPVSVDSRFESRMRQAVDVGVDHDNTLYIRTTRDSGSVVTTSIQQIMVCDSPRGLPIDDQMGCGSDGFVQYQLNKHKRRISHPHPEKIAEDVHSFYMQVDLLVTDVKTQHTVQDRCIVRVPLIQAPPDSYGAIGLGVGILALVGVVAIVVVVNQKGPFKPEYVPAEEQRKRDLQLATELNMYRKV